MASLPAASDSAVSARTPGATGDVDFHHDIARDIGQQVEMMILEAKHSSETKVGKEIQKIKLKMENMREKIKRISERLSRLEPANTGLLRSDLVKSIAKLEEVWEGEVGTLKHELWQTIQAHNHNADLLKHHKDAIDQVQSRMLEAVPNPELEQVHAQLMQVDKVMQREHAKEMQIDQFMHRLGLVQQQLGAQLGGWSAGMPPAFGMPQVPPHAVAAAAAAAAAAGKKTQRKVPKATKPAKASAPGASGAAASLRAEAPEFVPTTAAGWTES